MPEPSLALTLYDPIMNKLSYRTLAAATLLALGSCSTAGPFVTNISSDGNGNLVIEKSMIEYNGFMGTVTNKDVTSTTIRLGGN